MKRYFYILLLICFSGFSQHEDISLDDFKAMYFIQNHENISIQGIPANIDVFDFKKEYEIASINYEIQILKELTQDSLLLRKVNRWLSIKTIIDLAIDTSNSAEYLEFFYNNPYTRTLFDKYIKHPAQDYGSLSSEDSINLYYDVISFCRMPNLKFA